uniref:Zinc finger, GRF-type n=1 Tax=Tanacetum cinerariifolium TaxID=118510 RepID=A0A6L2LUU2_TANCI|nr:zinc finger, GRF-type [Tanacetum cinerariifolium]
MFVCPCGEDDLGEKFAFLGLVNPPMCLRDVDIIFGLLKNRNQLEDLLDMTEEGADFEEHRAKTEETRENMD